MKTLLALVLYLLFTGTNALPDIQKTDETKIKIEDWPFESVNDNADLSNNNRKCQLGDITKLKPTITTTNYISTDFYVRLTWSITEIDSSCIKQAIITKTYALNNVNVTDTITTTDNPVFIRNLNYTIRYFFKATIENIYNETNAALPVTIIPGLLHDGKMLQLRCQYDYSSYAGIVDKIGWFYEGRQINTTENSQINLNLIFPDKGTYTCKLLLRNGQSFESKKTVDAALLSNEIVKINRTELVNDNSIKVTLNKLDSSLNLIKYRVLLSTDDFKTSFHWPAQLVQINTDLKETIVLSKKTNSFYECFNECMEHSDCIAVTATIANNAIENNFFLKKAVTTISNLPSNSETRTLKSFTSNTNEIFISNLPYNQIYKVKISVFDSTNKYWSKYSEESQPINMLLKLSYTYERIAIKMHEIRWFQDTFSGLFPISRFAIVSSDSFNQALLDNINTTQTYNIEPNYYEFPFGVSPERNVTDKHDCFKTCLNTQECVQYIFFKKQITLFGIQISTNTCYLKQTLNLQTGVIADLETVDIGSLKSNLGQTLYRINENANVSVVGFTPYGSNVQSNFHLITLGIL